MSHGHFRVQGSRVLESLWQWPFGIDLGVRATPNALNATAALLTPSSHHAYPKSNVRGEVFMVPCAERYSCLRASCSWLRLCCSIVASINEPSSQTRFEDVVFSRCFRGRRV